MENRFEQALALHEKGYNCAQAVVCAYCDQVGLDEQTAYRISEGFGLGMGQMEVCGALTGAFMLAGLKSGGGIETVGQTKAQTYQKTKQIGEAFRAQNGTILCRELKGVADGVVRRTCPGCIEDACRLVEQFLTD